MPRMRLRLPHPILLLLAGVAVAAFLTWVVPAGEFERRTGIGAVLNTSFNLHGEPLVGSPADAVDTFERSGLPHLALGRFLISKR